MIVRILAALATVVSVSMGLGATPAKADTPVISLLDALIIPTVTDPDLNEDEHGWNCYIDGNGYCGDLAPTSPGCLTNTDDGYTMCANGVVYYLNADGSKKNLVIRLDTYLPKP